MADILDWIRAQSGAYGPWLASADASRAFDLRCDVREALMKLIAEEMPQFLPRRRHEPVPDREAARRALVPVN